MRGDLPERATKKQKEEWEERVKLRFNTNWYEKDIGKYYDFIEMYNGNEKEKMDFKHYILSNGDPNSKNRNKVGEIQFQFIKIETYKEYDKWLFVGAYKIIKPFKEELYTDINGKRIRYAESEKLDYHDKYIDRLIVKRGKMRSWINNAKKTVDSVELYSITSESYFKEEIEFPGYESFSKTYEELKNNKNNKSWKNHLSAVYGVYLITDNSNGKLYVGSAYGEDGIYGRWLNYLEDGYNRENCNEKDYPNKHLKAIVEDKKRGIDYVKKYFQYTILEIFQKNEVGKANALAREKY